MSAALACAERLAASFGDAICTEAHGDTAAVITRRVTLVPGISHLYGYAVLPDPCPGVSVEGDGRVPCHGGVTYDEAREGFRVVGFDCAHFGDRGNVNLTPAWALREAHALAAWMLANGAALAAHGAEVSL